MHNPSKTDHDALTYHPQARWMPGGRQPVAGMGATLLLPAFAVSRPSSRPQVRGFQGARLNDKSVRRMTSRKISTVAEQLRARQQRRITAPRPTPRLNCKKGWVEGPEGTSKEGKCCYHLGSILGWWCQAPER